MPAITLETPDESLVRSEVAPVLLEARDLAVVDVDSHERGLVLIAGLTKMGRRVTEIFAESKRTTHAAHKAVTEAEGRFLRPLDEAKRLINNKCTTFEIEQRRIAAAEAARLEAIARQDEENRRLEEAVAAEDAGDNETAEAIISAPPAPVVVHVAPAVAKVEGVSTRTTWKAEVEDKGKLVAYVAAHPEWLNLLDPNMPALHGLARSAQSNLSIPGIKAVPEVSRAVR